MSQSQASKEKIMALVSEGRDISEDWILKTAQFASPESFADDIFRLQVACVNCLALWSFNREMEDGANGLELIEAVKKRIDREFAEIKNSAQKRLVHIEIGKGILELATASDKIH